MPARSGQQYIDGLKERDAEIWLNGERVRDVTTHPGLSGGVRAVAHLYDMQHQAELREVMTYASPSSGQPVGRSFDNPPTREALEVRSKMMLNWAHATCGMMGRSPDFMNVTFAAWGAAAEFFGEKRPEFGSNMRNYVEYLRENDIVLTHSLINLQRSRNVSGMFNLSEGTALEVVKETSAGIVVKGARILATLGPLADEIAVYSPRLARHSEEHSPFAVNFSIPCNTKGLRFLCRDSFDLGRSHFDHPLGSRFEEMDCVVFFDDVLVPWERVFLLYDVERLNATPHVTHSTAHSAHQGAAKNLAKCEFVLGIALLMGQTLGNGHLPHTEERIGELMLYTELMRSCMRAAEADAAVDQWGVMCPAILPVESTRNLMMTAYPRMIEILHLLGSSSFLIQPSEKDFAGPLREDIEQYLATDNTSAQERVKLFRLAWDVAGSAFGSRQVLYERFFASDPLTRARAMAAIYPKDAMTARVREFLGKSNEEW
ncbi:MAG TPA: 4-hydroxyphenylacetate 3-monooxygenase, oxygenase component [Stellaceae bacterium]|jgi:4-hydroxyphenylacetate 3-monooxygenase|nr:4-hydroxyphenylacetate 3-monooxygenase, oxygenase component [Stellaceae bacterium]